ncbi:NAD(P)-dependent dehydrogenase (short-subunit alcohol dehydrogenase family) [Thermocatellispora tengchongensis]|uniref:NAD(P)-dependent dehydrogenase (Short-subunit alcohol dehydrogenase family) n=1 Tax=Thermocatellispora tengchongensis TaxID=1073253 RepID=A0A840PBS9_9ACTN|nr:SDR family oxidoreductase [Thermocatellispora tengchongensis]MBB5138864.1 NAD(P)-dependent dehydrogenase (short-subunit alcohol dehydrogenase family) [Thermocatellispora tengchongensis]
MTTFAHAPGPRSAVVTGAASGIGRAVAELFAARGTGVVAVDVDEAGLKQLAGLDGVLTLAGSVSEEDVSREAVALAVREHGRLDAAVLNAGIGGTLPFEEPGAVAAADRIFSVNLRGPILGIRAAVPALRAAGGGAIVVTASVAGIRADPGNWAYNASKGAVLNLVRAAALDYAVDGIRVNALAPGLTRTRINAGVHGDPGLRELVTRNIPLRRFAEPAEQAEAAWFLASPAASYITGTTLVVDGGLDANLGLLPLPEPR